MPAWFCYDWDVVGHVPPAPVGDTWRYLAILGILGNHQPNPEPAPNPRRTRPEPIMTKAARKFDPPPPAMPEERIVAIAAVIPRLGAQDASGGLHAKIARVEENGALLSPREIRSRMRYSAREFIEWFAAGAVACRRRICIAFSGMIGIPLHASFHASFTVPNGGTT